MKNLWFFLNSNIREKKISQPKIRNLAYVDCSRKKKKKVFAIKMTSTTMMYNMNGLKHPHMYVLVKLISYLNNRMIKTR